MEGSDVHKINLQKASSSREALRTPLLESLDISSLTDIKSEYREDIWKNLLEQEAEKPPIHLQSPQLEFRGTLVQHLRDVTKKLGLSLATLHHAVAQLDLFMDAHRLRSDRLKHVALACLSLAAKSEEIQDRAPSLQKLSKISGVKLDGKTFRQLEWMVGQHARWRLLSPTPVTFAALLTQFVVTDDDLTTRHHKFVRRFKKDGMKFLDMYLDLTLCDVRLKVVESVDVGCACVACARSELGLVAWPPALAAAAGRPHSVVVPIARRLLRMMQLVNSRGFSLDFEVDQGYGSARTSPNLTPCTSPQIITISPATSSCSSTSTVDTSYRNGPVDRSQLQCPGAADSTTQRQEQGSYESSPVDLTCQRVNHPADYSFCRSSRLIEASLNSIQPSTSIAVKRGIDSNADHENKRYRLTAQMSQVVL